MNLLCAYILAPLGALSAQILTRPTEWFAFGVLGIGFRAEGFGHRGGTFRVRAALDAA